MQLLMRALLLAGVGLTLIDPHGDLASDLEAYCATLPERHRRRVIIIRYSDTSRLAGNQSPLYGSW